MKKFVKTLSLVLVVVMLMAAFAACSDSSDTSSPAGNSSGSDSTATDSTDTSGTVSEDDGDDDEEIEYGPDVELYDDILGEFYEAYAEAKKASDTAERYALMAIAEAKLMEAAVMVPLQANGGNYAISKVAPYTISPVLWGNDSYRYHNALVCTEPLKTEDRDALKALWKETTGSGTYFDKAKEYLTEKGYEFKNKYSIAYNSDPQTFDVLVTSNASDSEVLVNTYDGLMEYDGENRLLPALATEWSVSDDGLTWTFKLREGVKWVDSTGAEIAEVKADDFVAGLQHMLDHPEGGLSYLVEDKIVGTAAYGDADNPVDFSEVGVKAVDDHTLEYTLMAPTPYFDTMFGYGIFAPLCRTYYTSQGGEFGLGSSSGSYGTDKDHIVYCGPYLIDTYVSNNSIVFKKNESYWNKDNIVLDEIKWVYVDTSIATQSYSDFKDGKIDGCGLNSAAVTMAKNDGNFEKYAYVSSTGASTYPGFFNVNRGIFTDPVDETKLVSNQTDEQKAVTKAAMQNQNFRLALTMSLDRASYMEQSVGADLKLTSLVNSYTPGTFVYLPTDVTVKINGEDKTYKTGTAYGQIMQDQVTADGYPMTVYDPNADGGAGSSGGYDGWLNVEKAKEYMAKAIEELKEAGVEVSASNPVHIDYPHLEDGASYTAAANAVKTSIEGAFDGCVVVDLYGTDNQDDYLNSTYWFNTADTANYDLSLNSGWGPDYGDPSTYLDTMVKGGGYMLKCLGLDA